MSMELWLAILDFVGGLFLIFGTWFTLIAALGLVRFEDLLSRMHAATKPQTLGLSLVAIGMALTVRSVPVAFTLLLVVAFQMITSPISAHMVSRAAYRTGATQVTELAADELLDDIRSTEIAMAIEDHGRRNEQETRLDAEGQ